MLDTDMVHDTGHFSYADADRLASLWNLAYPAMRKISTNYIERYREYIERKGWIVDPSHPYADTLRTHVTLEDKARRKLKLGEDLRRDLGQLDRGTHRPCTRSPGCFSVTAAYMAVRNLISISSISSDGLPDIFRLAAVLAEAEERVNRDRAVRHRDRMTSEREKS